jgi:hypothetical protein
VNRAVSQKASDPDVTSGWRRRTLLTSLSEDSTQGARALLVLPLYGGVILRDEINYGRQDARHKLVVVLVGCIMQSLDDEIGGSVEEGRLAEGAETKRYEC